MTTINPLLPGSPLYPDNTNIIEDNFQNLNDDKIEDAPIDGDEYVRKNGAWSVNSGGGGAGTLDSLGALIGTATDAVPNDTDYVATALTGGGTTKKITWANVKAFLKTYFDTIYATALNLLLKQTVFTGICQDHYITENDIVIDGVSATPTLTIATIRNGETIDANNPIRFFTDGSGVAIKHEITAPVVFEFTYTTGVWYFYFDSSGTPIATQTPWTSFDTIATVYRLYVNSTLSGQDRIQVEAVEYHKNDISWTDHGWKHAQGTIWQNGLDIVSNAISSGSPNADGRNAVVALSSGTCMDDNLPYTITHATGGTVKFTQDLGNTTPASLNATNSAIFNIRGNDSSGRLVKQAGTRFPFSWDVATNKPEYISTLGVRTIVQANYYFVYYIYSLQDPRRGETLKVVSAQQDFANATLALAHSWETLQTLYPTLKDNEIRPLYKLTFEYKTSYDAGSKYSALRTIDDIRKQKVTTTAVASGSLPATAITEVTDGNAQTAFDNIRTSLATKTQTCEAEIKGPIYKGQVGSVITIKEAKTFTYVSATLQSLPTGGNVTIQAYKNGILSTNSIFTSDTPITITTSQGADSSGLGYTTISTTIDNGTFAAGDKFIFWVTLEGSTLPGSDLYLYAV